MDKESALKDLLSTAVGKSPVRQKALLFSLRDYLFKDIDFSGKSMLDIGGGSGKYSFYAGLMGAEHVVCLEPEAAGSADGFQNHFRNTNERLGLKNVELRPCTFQQYENDRTFDIVFLHNSINHLNEEACSQLGACGDARSAYQLLFDRIYNLSNPKARLIVCDCSRHNFFQLIGIKNPFVPSIEWHKHQSPSFWSALLQECGFKEKTIQWTSFNSLGHAGRIFLGNRSAAYFLHSQFCLRMERN